MLTLLFALALCLPQSPAASPTRLVLETFPDGKPQREYEVADIKGTTQKHGTFREWHANGALKCEGKFEKDLETGAWSFFGDAGQPLASGRFAKGERVGAWTEHWPDGTKKLEGKYAKGRREGRWKAWNADGSVDAAGTGVWSFQSSTWPDGTPRDEGYTCNGVRHGEWTSRAPSGAPDWHGEFRAGLRHGSWTFHRADGTLHGEGHYVDGVAEGAWTSFWEDGKPQVSGTYSAGKRSGSWQLLHPDGRVATALITGAYSAGTRSEPATSAGAKAETAEDLAAYPKAASAFESNAVLATRIAEFVEQASGNDAAAQAAAFQWLAYYGRAALPVVLEKLARIDLTKAPGASLAERFDVQYFRRAFVGASFPLPRGITPAANAGRFEWLRSWYSLWALTHDDLAYWAIDLRGEPRTNDTEAARAALLAAPPIFEPDRALAVHERTPIARYALRFAPREDATPELLASVREGLAWLAAHQDIRGWWDTANFADSCGRIGRSVCDGTVLRSRYVGVTGLALLAFLADGNTPEHGPFASSVARAVGVLLELQDGKTGMFFADWTERDAAGVERRYVPSDFVYDHAIATLALSEALAVSEHSALRKRL
ncbi:MAG: hypothetical protein IT453_14930, partial [Planctomycetes bacterium]|nr:hypothetical protein [Planctomycetota bacterium]